MINCCVTGSVTLDSVASSIQSSPTSGDLTNTNAEVQRTSLDIIWVEAMDLPGFQEFADHRYHNGNEYPLSQHLSIEYLGFEGDGWFVEVNLIYHG